MLTLCHNPEVQEILDRWYASLPRNPASTTGEMAVESLRCLVGQLVQELDEILDNRDKRGPLPATTAESR
jgi:hypothetical protein